MIWSIDNYKDEVFIRLGDKSRLQRRVSSATKLRAQMIFYTRLPARTGHHHRGRARRFKLKESGSDGPNPEEINEQGLEL